VRLVPPTFDGASLWLATPTRQANQLMPSMRKHSGCRLLQDLAPGGRNPHPRLFEWMMGYPDDWTEIGR